MEEQRILDAIESLRGDLGGRLDSIEKRLSASEDQQKKLSERQRRSERDINTLFARLDQLCEDRPIWVSKDQREVGVRKEEAYEVFKKLGFGRLEALRLLDKAGRLSRNNNDKHYAKAVRSKKVGRTRAVVIFMEDD